MFQPVDARTFWGALAVCAVVALVEWLVPGLLAFGSLLLIGALGAVCLIAAFFAFLAPAARRR